MAAAERRSPAAELAATLPLQGSEGALQRVMPAKDAPCASS